MSTGNYLRPLSTLASQIALSAALTVSAFAQPAPVVVATTGGTYDRALKEVWFEPFTTATGIKVATVVATDSEQRTRAQAMANAGKVTWDIINNVDIIAESAQNRSFSRDLTTFCKAFETERAALQTLLASTRPFGVAHWPAALAGDDAAAVAMAMKLTGIDVLDTYRHDVVLSMLLWHALKGSPAAKATLAFTLDRRRYVGEDVDALTRSWRGPSRAEIRRAELRDLMEALS